MPTNIVTPSSANLLVAADCLKRGDVVAIPTETVYGLAANAYDEKAVRKIFELKGRPSHNPLIVHIASLDQLALVTTEEVISKISPTLEKLKSFIPGPLSFVVNHNNKLAPSVSAGLDTVAIRVPRHPVAQELMRQCELPIAAPSANPSNYVSPTTAAHVADQLGEKLTLILDGGQCDVGLESTILDLSGDTPKILRQGIVTAEALSLALGIPSTTLLRRQPPDREEPIIAPGMLKEHYAPRTPLTVLADLTERCENSRIGLIFLNGQQMPTLSFTPEIAKSLSETGDFEEISRNLFKTMREFDTLGLDLIVVEGCAPEGIGRAIMDRLSRASARSKK